MRDAWEGKIQTILFTAKGNPHLGGEVSKPRDGGVVYTSPCTDTPAGCPPIHVTTQAPAERYIGNLLLEGGVFFHKKKKKEPPLLNTRGGEHFEPPPLI